MIDRKALQDELEWARRVRRDAEAAGCEVEELICAMQQFRPGRHRLLFMVDIGDATHAAVRQ